MNKINRYFVTGIGTDIGKTVVAAILTESLRADYWKPIQAGNLDDLDSGFVANNCSFNPKIYPEAYLFNTPVSPHLAAKIDGVDIDTNQFVLPNSDNALIVEGAGGLLVPLTENYYIKDLIKQLQLSVILVVKHYLGSINHTLLTIEALQQFDIPLTGIVFNGEPNGDSEKIIEAYTKAPVLARIPFTNTLNKAFIGEQAKQVDWNLL